MTLATLLPHLVGLRVARLELFPDELILEVVATAASARCPACARSSRRIHGRYTRTIADQPIGERRVTIRLGVRRFRCRQRACPQATFAEPTPRLAARYGRRSAPLQRFLQDVGLTVGGRPGARFAARGAIRVGRMTLLRLVRALPDPPAAPPTVLGVDDFALARGHRYGSVVVDLERHQVVDLLPDRTADTVAMWLREHGPPAILCRDRGGSYAEAGRLGAPDAVQVADRFHVLRNATDVLERIVARHPAALRAASAAPSSPVPPAAPRAAPAVAAPTASLSLPPPAARPLTQCHARYEAIIALQRQGLSVSAISRRVPCTRLTVRKYLRAGHRPEPAPKPSRLHALSPHAAYLRARWTDGCQDAAVLWQDLRARGFTGSARTVRRHVQAWRTAPRRRRPPRQSRGDQGASAPRPPAPRPLSPRQALWLLLRPLEELAPDQQAMRGRLLAAAPTLHFAVEQVDAFRRLVRTRDHAALAPWLTAAATSDFPEIRGFAGGLRRDLAAVEAALTHAWSSGQVEGQVTKIKVIKRQMYGRAKIDLLRKRVLLVS